MQHDCIEDFAAFNVDSYVTDTGDSSKKSSNIVFFSFTSEILSVFQLANISLKRFQTKSVEIN